MADDFQKIVKGFADSNKQLQEQLDTERARAEFLESAEGKLEKAQKRRLEREIKAAKKAEERDDAAYQKRQDRLETLADEFKNVEEKLKGIVSGEQSLIAIEEKRLENMKKMVDSLEKYENLGSQLKDSLLKPFDKLTSKIPEPLKILGKMGVGAFKRMRAKGSMSPLPGGVAGPQEAQEGMSREEKDEQIERENKSVETLVNIEKAILKGNKIAEKDDGKGGSRFFLLGALGALLTKGLSVAKMGLGVIVGVLTRFVLPIIAALGIGTLGKYIVDRVIDWFTGSSDAKGFIETAMDMSMGEMLGYGLGGFAAYKGLRFLGRKGFDAFKNRTRNITGGGGPRGQDLTRTGTGAGTRTPPGVGPTRANAAALKAEKEALAQTRKTAEAARKASQARAAARAAALTRALAPIIAFSQTARTKIAETVTKLKSVGAKVGEITKKLAPKASKVGGKVLTRAGALAATALGGPFAPFLAAGVTLYFAAKDGIDGWNNAAKILGKPEADIKFIDRINASGYAVASGLTFGLVSAREIAEAFEKAKKELAAQKVRRQQIASDLLKINKVDGTGGIGAGKKALDIVNEMKNTTKDKSPISTGFKSPQLRKFTVGGAGTKKDLETPLSAAEIAKRKVEDRSGYTLFKELKIGLGLAAKLIKNETDRKQFMLAIRDIKKTSVDSTNAGQIRAVINEFLAKGILPLSLYNQLKRDFAAQGFSMGGNTVVDYRADNKISKSYTIGAGGGFKDGMGNTVPMAR